jgi:hypothetical protein
MDATDHTERELANNSICRLEWIAWAMDAARRHKEAEHLGGLSPQPNDRPCIDEDD